MKKLKLELEVVLPHDAAACDACASRIVAALTGQPGVVEAHLDGTRLCLHYDPGATTPESVKQLVSEAGGEVARRVEHFAVEVSGVRHERQARLAEGALARLPGVLSASVASGTAQVHLEFDPAKTTREDLETALPKAGLKVARKDEHGDHEGHDHEHGGPFGARSELVFSLACGALTGVGWGIGKFGAPALASTALFVVAYVLGSWFTLREVAVALRARKFEIDFLMLLAAAGAAVLGQWFEGALLLFLFTLGHALEGYAMRRARKAVEALGRLAPPTAVVLENGVEREVRVEDLRVGARVLVKPNTRVPADGFVEQGSGSVNQAPITGESMPADKRPVEDVEQASRNPSRLAAEHRVFAGTINGTVALTVRVTRVAADSTLARVVKLVASAETQKSATQQFTDRFERSFVPIIIAIVILLLFAWVVVDEPFAKSFYRAMAVLVAASPCALAIATPSAVLSGVARAARAGVLIKGGAHLEALGAVTAIAFDKTGTLTEGKPRLVEARPMEGFSEDQLLRVAWALERKSDHPLAEAVVVGAEQRLGKSGQVEDVTDARAIIGFGIEGTLGGQRVLIGKPGLFMRDGGSLPDLVRSAAEEQEAAGRTVMIVQQGAAFLGVLGVLDTPRESARKVVSALHQLGIRNAIMLTGDNQKVAEVVGREVGIDEVRGDLLPEHKVAAIASLARSGTRVAMVGDGVNDAPAMANASVGIAMGAGGSDVALETADIALMADDLSALPFAVGLSRAAGRVIQQNLWASLGMVAFLIPATVLGFAGIGVAVALHEGSTLLVVANALRLLAYQDERAP